MNQAGTLKTEQLEEGWVKFTRFYCKEGWLDRWVGDCINNPNSATVHSMQLNAYACYWRCNDGTWLNDREIGRSEIFIFLEKREEFTAKEIWGVLLKKFNYDNVTI